ATNRAAYNVYVTPQYLAEGDLARIAALMGLGDEERRRLEERVANGPPRRRSHQIRVFRHITRAQLAALETHEQELCVRTTSRNPVRLPCLSMVSEPVRTYPFGTLGAHALGYLNEMNAEELARLRQHGYRLGDRIGRTGIERAWETFLRGRR